MHQRQRSLNVCQDGLVQVSGGSLQGCVHRQFTSMTLGWSGAWHAAGVRSVNQTHGIDMVQKDLVFLLPVDHLRPEPLQTQFGSK